jgi:hypothetical protein
MEYFVVYNRQGRPLASFLFDEAKARWRGGRKLWKYQRDIIEDSVVFALGNGCDLEGSPIKVPLGGGRLAIVRQFSEEGEGSIY